MNTTENQDYDLYDEIKDELEQSNPEGLQLLREQLTLALKDKDFDAEEVDTTIKVFDYVIRNNNRYEEIREQLIAQDIVDDDDLPPKFDPVFFSVGLIALHAIRDSKNKFASGGIAQLANELQGYGRNGDSLLAHINPQEAELLKALGGSGTINPVTGLPEFFLKKALKKVGKAVSNVVKGIGDAIVGVAKGVGNLVEDVVESPVGRVLATAALTAVGAPYLAPLGFSAAGTAALVSGSLTAATGGDLGDIAKSAALSFVGSTIVQGLQAPGTFDASSALETQFALPGMEFSNLPVPSWDTGYPGSTEVPTGSLGPIAPPGLPPGEAGIRQILSETAGASPDYVDDLFSGAGAPTPDVAFPEMFAPPGAGYDLGYALNEVNQPFTPEPPPGAGYDLGYALNEVNQPFTPEPTLDPTLGDPTAAPGGMPDPASGDPSLGDPTAGYGGMPKLSLSDQLSIAGMTAGAGIKSILSNPVGQFLAGKALQSLVGGGPQGIQIPGGTGSGSGIAQPSLQYAQVPEFDVTKAFSPTLYAMRQQKQG
jgi:hypothetical protein